MSPPLQITVSAHFCSWLYEEHISLALTTYQANRLFLLGLKPDGRLSIFERIFDKPMGLDVTGDTLRLATRYQIWRMENALPAGQSYEGYDRIYVPRSAHTTGELDVHDVAVDRQGRLVFVNTAYSCLAALSDRYSFKPLWRPPFISRLAPEDRCHLNGLAMDSGAPAFVTTVSRSDVVGGWRDRRQAGGCLIDVRTNELLLNRMSMPHSPRCHEGRIWLLDAGRGELGFLDEKRRAFEPVAFCPGFLRGLAIYNGYALVGMSKPRRQQAFQGLELDERLASKDSDAQCGLHVIDLKTGYVAHWLRIEGVVEELYDVKVLPLVRMPMVLGFKTDEIQRLITIDNPAGPVFEARARLPGVPANSAHPPGPAAAPEPFADESSPDAAQPAPSGPEQQPPIADLMARARLARQTGRLVEAETLFRQALELQPGSIRAHYALANLLVKQDRLQEAIEQYEAVLAREPAHSNALNNLGTIQHRLGRSEAAVDFYRRAIEADDRFHTAYRNLATTLQSLGRLEEAATLYDRALQRYPQDAVLFDQAGLACHELGLIEQALAHFRRAVELDPDFAEAHNHLGGILALLSQKSGEDVSALSHYRQAAKLKPELAAAHRNIGVILEDRGELEEARAAYRQALELEPDPGLELHLATLFPFVAPGNEAIDAYRNELETVLSDFSNRGLQLELSRVQSSKAEPPFHWAFQGREDSQLRARYAGLFSHTAFPKDAVRSNRAGRIRLGFVASLSHEAVFMRCMAGVINRLPADRFELMMICPRTGQPVLRNCLTQPQLQYVTLPLRFDHAVSAIRSAACDVLYYWETGTDSTNYFLPFCRLAPVQCTGWGWPITSGAPEMDYYVTCAGLTTPESDAHFTEKLVRLPSLPPHFERLPFPETAPSGSDFGLPDDRHLYVCLQNLRKVHPDFDDILGAILRNDPAGLVIFVSDTRPAVTELLRKRWQDRLPDVLDRIRILPRLPGMDYCRLVMLADVVLDTLHFGGANTAYDALGAGKPIVTLPNADPRGRYTSACYQTLGISECIAGTPQGYIEIALRLGTDTAWRQSISARIAAESGRLFENEAPVSELSDFFEQAVAAARG